MIVLEKVNGLDSQHTVTGSHKIAPILINFFDLPFWPDALFQLHEGENGFNPRLALRKKGTFFETFFFFCQHPRVSSVLATYFPLIALESSDIKAIDGDISLI